MNDRLRHSEQPALALPSIRQDLRLYPGSAQQDGSPTWRILDPVRNSFFEIGWLEFEMLARWSGAREGAALAARVAAETPLKPSADEVADLIEFLATNQLLAPGSAEARAKLSRRREGAHQSWLT